MLPTDAKQRLLVAGEEKRAGNMAIPAQRFYPFPSSPEKIR